MFQTNTCINEVVINNIMALIRIPGTSTVVQQNKNCQSRYNITVSSFYYCTTSANSY